MADYMSAKITIGGKLKASDVDTLIKAIVDQAVSLEYDEAPPEEDEIRERLNENEVVFYDIEARYGQFEDLEQVCRDLGLNYVRHSEGKYDYEAEFVVYEPGMDEPLELLATNDGRPACTLDDLKEMDAAVLVERLEKATSCPMLEIV